MNKTCIFSLALVLAAAITSCKPTAAPERPAALSVLERELTNIAENADGCIGIAFIGNGDTIEVNGSEHFPLMSVFKLHQSLAVLATLEKTGRSADSLLHLRARELDLSTWSPMLQFYRADEFDISIRELIERSIIDSDNNTSNLLFEHVVGAKETESIVRAMARNKNFAIKKTESEMKRDNILIYENYSTPLAATMLIMQVFEDSFLTPENQKVIKDALLRVATGSERIAAPLSDVEGAQVAHKTGSGYRSRTGLLTVFNDVAYITLPDGRSYGLAVMIRNFNGSPKYAEEIMAEISRQVYEYMK